MAEESDKTHRLLFGFASMVENLIRLCLPGPWIEHFDFSTLEPVSERLLTEEGDVRRDGDLFWRLKYAPNDGQQAFDVVFNLEHISQRGRWTSLDLTTYKVMAWQKLARSKTLKPRALLPEVVSVVVYTGDDPWPEVTPLEDLIEHLEESPPGTELGDAVVVDIQHWKVGKVAMPVEALFKLHQMESVEELEELLRDLRPMVAKDEKLAKAFLGVINDDVFRKMAQAGEKPFRIKSLEDTTMLAQRVERIRDDLIETGERRGLKTGKREG